MIENKNINDDPVLREKELDGYRSIAQKIRNRLQQLENASEKDKRRWIWELLQNAVDAANGEKVDIEIILNTDYVKFKHNGGYFLLRHLTNLVNQISSKEGTESIGRFGTGFLTTHTLSKIVEVEGAFVPTNEPNEFTNEYFQFNITLDRTGKTEKEIVLGLEKTWNSSYKKKLIKNPQKPFWTIFKYINPDTETAKFTIDDFETIITYCLAFVPQIQNITIQDKIENNTIKFKRKDPQSITEQHKIITIEKSTNDTTKEINIFCSQNNDVSIAIEINTNNNTTEILPVKENVPRLFCAYPLIGSEQFCFPFVINSEKFNPTQERENIYLRGETNQSKPNKELLKQAVELYKSATTYITEQKWKELYLLAKHSLPPQTDDFDTNWYIENVQNKIREHLINIPIVESQTGELLQIAHETKFAYFPFSGKAEERDKIWTLINDIYPSNLPTKKHIHDWFHILLSWENGKKIQFGTIVNFIEKQKGLSNFGKHLKNKESPVNWLNNFFVYLRENKKLELLSEKAVYPNQQGDFRKKSELYQDIDIPNELKNILVELEKEIEPEKEVFGWQSILLDKSITAFNNKHKLSPKTVKDISDKINKYIRDTEYSAPVEFRNIVLQLLGYSNSNKTETQHKVWEFARTMYFDATPEHIEVLQNSENFDWGDCIDWIVNRLVIDISELKFTEILQKEIYGSVDTVSWLDRVIDFLQHNADYRHLLESEEYPIIPNQSGDFCVKSHLYTDDEIPSELKVVIKALNLDWYNELLDKNIYLELQGRNRGKKEAATEIDRIFKEYRDSKQKPEFVNAWRTLLKWFREQNDEYVRDNFDWIYRHKADLSLAIMGDDEQKDSIFQIIESGNAIYLTKIAKGLSEEDIISLADNLEDYKEYVKSKNSNSQRTTKEALLKELNNETGENFTSIDDFVSKYKQSKRKIGFADEPTNRGAGYLDIEAIGKSNEEARDRLYEKLQSDINYDVSGWTKDTNTIISGVKKTGIDINIVVKGAKNGTIYFDKSKKEQKILSDTFSELWVLYQNEIFQITLGEIIKEWDVKGMKAYMFDF